MLQLLIVVMGGLQVLLKYVALLEAFDHIFLLSVDKVF